jgi:hypothetical protein
VEDIEVRKGIRKYSIAAFIAMSIACSGSGSPTEPTSTQASFSVSALPSPVTANRCNPQCGGQSGDNGFAFSAAMTVTIQELAGVGANISLVTLTGSTGTSTFTPLVFSSSDIAELAGGNHIAGKGVAIDSV